MLKPPRLGRIVHRAASTQYQVSTPNRHPKAYNADDYLHTLYNLDGKTAIVTGATGGIGSVVAEGLWMAGVNVVVHGHSKDKPFELVNSLYEKHNRSSGLLPFSADVTDQEELRAMVDATVRTFGSIDVLLNNAGMNLPEIAFERRKSQDWAKISAVNLTGPILITQLCLPYLKKCPSGGRIINTCSVGGHAGLSNNTLYTMTKGGMLLFTKSLAVELAQQNVTVNSLSPGIINTPMNQKYVNNEICLEEVDDPKCRDCSRHVEVVGQIPMGRLGTAQELVGAVLFLASSAASYCTGTDIVVDGGYTSQ